MRSTQLAISQESKKQRGGLFEYPCLLQHPLLCPLCGHQSSKMAPHIPREIVTADDYSPIVSILTWILLVSMVLSVCVKVALKLLISRMFNTDDGVLILAMVTHRRTRASVKLMASESDHQYCPVNSHFDPGVERHRTTPRLVNCI